MQEHQRLTHTETPHLLLLETKLIEWNKISNTFHPQAHDVLYVLKGDQTSYSSTMFGPLSSKKYQRSCAYGFIYICIKYIQCYTCKMGRHNKIESKSPISSSPLTTLSCFPLFTRAFFQMLLQTMNTTQVQPTMYAAKCLHPRMVLL